jgi:hypothetical protein
VLAHDLTQLPNRAVTIVSTAVDNERGAAGAVRLAANAFEIFRHRNPVRQLSFGAAIENRPV